MATVSISLLEITGAASAQTVLFIPKSTPFVQSGSVVIGGNVSAQTDSSGNGTATLTAGNYKVRIDEERFNINVPSSSGAYNLYELVS